MIDTGQIRQGGSPQHMTFIPGVHQLFDVVNQSG
jgi:hypothetical protein